MRFQVLHGDCREVMAGMEAESVDSVVCDPPYGLSFMGKGWDHGVPGVEFWQAALRVAKPGAYLLAFGGTRTFHRLMVAIEDAGWELRDTIGWVYGSGFPKSLDVSKALDKAAGAEREVIGIRESYRPKANAVRDPEGFQDRSDGSVTLPATDAAKQWAGWGTALKPAWEPIVVARKPLIGTVAENVLRHGAGGMNIDGCRVTANDAAYARNCSGDRGHAGTRNANGEGATSLHSGGGSASDIGRWPANIITDGSEEVLATFPVTASNSGEPFNRNTDKHKNAYSGFEGRREEAGFYGDAGSAARFFYCAKASPSDRDEGCEDLAQQQQDTTRNEGDPGGDNPRNRGARLRGNHHPTVKPTALMRYLCRLVTPPGGLVLDPFCGSGSTGKAARLEGFRFVGIEQSAEYVAIARARIGAASREAVETGRQVLLPGLTSTDRRTA